jgi:hypothetical protein
MPHVRVAGVLVLVERSQLFVERRRLRGRQDGLHGRLARGLRHGRYHRPDRAARIRPIPRLLNLLLDED